MRMRYQIVLVHWALEAFSGSISNKYINEAATLGGKKKWKFIKRLIFGAHLQEMEGVGEFSAHCVNKSEFVLLLHENLKSCWVCANAQLKKKMLEAIGKLIPAQF